VVPTLHTHIILQRQRLTGPAHALVCCSPLTCSRFLGCIQPHTGTCQTRSEAQGEPVFRRPPGVVKKHALCWVCHAHSQFENRSRSRGSPESCLSCVALPDVTTTKWLRIPYLHLSPAILRELRREPATRWLDWPFTPMPHSGYTICTSEQRPASTTVSHGFTVGRYSSPPFGSHGPCKHSKPCPLDVGSGDSMQVPPSGMRRCLHRALAVCDSCGESLLHQATCASSIDSLVRVTRRAVSGTDRFGIRPSSAALRTRPPAGDRRSRHGGHQQGGAATNADARTPGENHWFRGRGAWQCPETPPGLSSSRFCFWTHSAVLCFWWVGQSHTRHVTDKHGDGLIHALSADALLLYLPDTTYRSPSEVQNWVAEESRGHATPTLCCSVLCTRCCWEWPPRGRSGPGL